MESNNAPILSAIDEQAVFDRHLDTLKKTYLAHEWLITKIEQESLMEYQEAMTYNELVFQYEKFVETL
jgi:hypothetical protein